MGPVQVKLWHDLEVCFTGLLCVRELILYLSFIDVQIKYVLGACHSQKHHPL